MAPSATDAPPLRERVVADLTAAILGHRLQPGQRLVERELVEQLGVSRTTVREAIRELAADGLITVLPQRGAVVTSASMADARDLYDARSALESLLLRRFIERAEDAHFDRLLVSVHDLSTVVRSGAGTDEIMAQRDIFYEALFTGAASAVLQQMVESVQARVRLLCASSLSEHGRSAAAAEELTDVVHAVRQHDAERAAALMEEHLRKAAEATLRTLQPELARSA